MKKFLLFFLPCALLLLSGCGALTLPSSRQIDEWEVADLLAVDFDGEKATFTTIIRADKEEDRSVYQGAGDTFEQALESLQDVCPKRLLLEHLRFVLFGEEVEAQDAARCLEALLRQGDVRLSASVYQTQGKAAPYVEDSTVETLSGIMDEEQAEKKQPAATVVEVLRGSYQGTPAELNVVKERETVEAP